MRVRGSAAEAAGGPRGWAWSRGHAPHPGDTHWLAGPHPGRTCRLESLDVSAAPAVRRTRGRGRGRSAPRRQVPPGWRPGRVRRRRGHRGPRGAPGSEGGTRVRGGRYEAGSERGFGRPPLPSAESPDAGGGGASQVHVMAGPLRRCPLSPDLVQGFPRPTSIRRKHEGPGVRAGPCPPRLSSAAGIPRPVLRWCWPSSLGRPGTCENTGSLIT